MNVQWYGQSAFRLNGADASVFIDPFGSMEGLGARGLSFDYPPIEDVTADLVLVTHEHRDHNGVEAIGGDPVVLRATAGTHESPVGDVVAVASEHDAAAGTQRGPNAIFRFELDGIRVAHLGDLGQGALRDEQAEAIGSVDLLFVPVGGGPTIGAEQARAIVDRLAPRWVVPMHYRTPRVDFLEGPEAFLERMPRVARLDASWFETAELEDGEGPLAVVPAAP
jgi:L-ascorbate metabolism protein UlaG (beta-lactamase superfamily)